MSAQVSELIRRKRDGGVLAPAEIAELITGVTSGAVGDEQAGALLMAIFFRGLDAEELHAWTQAMLHSGDVLSFPQLPGVKVDKHSTGGVGDKISLPLAAAVAACGLHVPMISGRGLGHTGGTLDKLESIPGFDTRLSPERFGAVLADVGCCIIGQTERLAPADRRLYALRDVTGTVESIPLIASSILSKKLAEGIDALVLDIKVGSGAFMKTVEQARELAHTMIGIGEAAGKRMTAVLTDMSRPTGRTIGNALEVEESIETLRGKGPADTRALTVALGAEMLLLGNVAKDAVDGAHRIATVLDSGAALDRFRRMIVAQGGDARVINEPNRLPRAPHNGTFDASTAGYLSVVDAEALGLAALVLGGGRQRKEDLVDPAVGLEMLVLHGEKVGAGSPLVRMHHANKGVDAAHAYLSRALEIVPAPPFSPPLVLEILRGNA